MINEILSNLTLIGYAALVFALAYCSNMCFSLWYNTKILNEEFSWARLKTGILKVVSVLLGIVLLCSAITLLPYVLTQIGLDISETVENIVDIVTIVGAVVLTSTKYIKESYETFIAILNKGEKK
jgi:amino acid transporter